MRVGAEEGIAVISATLLVPTLPLLTKWCVPVKSLVDWSPVVDTRGAIVDLLPDPLFDVVDEGPARLGLYIETVRVPEPRCSDCPVLARSLCVKRIVRRNRVGLFAYPEHFAEKTVQGLGGRRPGILPDRHVELVLFALALAEMYGSALVVGRRQGRQLKNNLLSPG